MTCPSTVGSGIATSGRTPAPASRRGRPAGCPEPDAPPPVSARRRSGPRRRSNPGPASAAAGALVGRERWSGESGVRAGPSVVDSHPADARLAEHIRSTLAGNSRFPQMRNPGAVGGHAEDRKTIGHPVVGDITADCDVLVDTDTDLTIVVYTAAPRQRGRDQARTDARGRPPDRVSGGRPGAGRDPGASNAMTPPTSLAPEAPGARPPPRRR